MAAILDLSNMAATDEAHLGTLEKLVGDGFISFKKLLLVERFEQLFD